jgi:aromatic ring-opening dioxygenase catalytic subunit (LigB family)
MLAATRAASAELMGAKWPTNGGAVLSMINTACRQQGIPSHPKAFGLDEYGSVAILFVAFRSQHLQLVGIASAQASAVYLLKLCRTYSNTSRDTK